MENTDYNSYSGGQAQPAPGGERCPNCGAIMIGGRCPVCGAGKRRGSTAGRAVLAILLTLVVGGAAGFLSLYQIGRTAAQAQPNAAGGGNNRPAVSSGSQPEPAPDPLDTGREEPGFYWGDWADYLYSYDDMPDAAYGTIYDARTEGLSYSVSDFTMKYSGCQSLRQGSRGNRGTPAGEGTWVDFDAHYVQLSGDSPYIDEINDVIRYWALDGVYTFIEPTDYLYEYMTTYDSEQFASETDTFVTYMSENFLSIGVFESDTVGGTIYHYAYTLNFDMNTGEMVELYDILTPDDAFMQAFDELGAQQFPDSQGFTAYSSSERRTLLDGSGIDPLLLIQPDMVQIGYNYNLNDKGIDTSGWLTVEYEPDQVPEAIRERCYS